MVGAVRNKAALLEANVRVVARTTRIYEVLESTPLYVYRVMHAGLQHD